MRLPKLVTLAVTVALAMTACGPDKVDPDAYAQDVCDTTNDWIQKIQQESTAITSQFTGDASPEQAKEAYVNFLDTAVNETENVLEDLDAAGIPDIDEGEELADTLKKGFEDARGAFQQARDEAEELDTSDQSAFASAVQEIAQTMQTSLRDVSQTFQNVDPEMRDRLQECAAAPPA